jgi:catechol 2,3-dioxygenase-like lactoylglutathione lyase family enzyme
MEPKLGPLRQIGISCRDLRASVKWYREALGLEFIAEFTPPGIAFFRLGSTRLMLTTASNAARNSVLYFEVGDVEARQRELEARGVKFSGPPHRIHRDDTGTFGPVGGEEWMTFFEDPDGNTLALAELRLVREER